MTASERQSPARPCSCASVGNILTSRPVSQLAALWAAPQSQTERGSSCCTCPAVAAVGTVAHVLAGTFEEAQEVGEGVVVVEEGHLAWACH